MMFDYELACRAMCGDSEKLACKDLIDKLVDFSELARKEGILAIEDHLAEINSPLLRQGLQLVVDGTDPEIISSIMKNIIYMEGKRGKELLIQCIIHDGVLSIQKGYTPELVEIRLLSYLGEVGYGLLEEYKQEELDRMRQLISDLKKENSTTATVDIMEKYIPKLEDRYIQKILREIDTCELAKALRGVSSLTKACILGNMSLRAAIMLIKDMEYMGPIRKLDIIEAQTKIENIIKKLYEMAEIYYDAI